MIAFSTGRGVAFEQSCLTHYPGDGCTGVVSSLAARLNLRKTYPAAHGLPFAYAQIAGHFAIIRNCIFLLITMAYEILRGSMGC